MVNFHALGKSPSAPGFRLLGAALVVTILFFTFYSPFTPTEDIGFPAGHRPSSLGAANATLGFQKLFAISLPQRTDRHDALTLVSVLSGLEIEVAPGIRGEDVLTKTIPRAPDSVDMIKPGFVGSWRAHLNIMKRIIDEKITTALIIEDDADWDVNVREQMARVLHEFRLDKQGKGSVPGLTADWDLLWLGNVGERFPKDDQRKIVFQDPTVPSHQEMSPGFEALKDFPEKSRIIHPTDFPVCSYAYAVTYEGAQKVLYHASLDKVMGNFDSDLANNCWLYMNCISVTPPLFHFDRSIGLDRDSDTDQAMEKHFIEPGSYMNVKNSVRRAMKEHFGTKKREGRVWRDNSEWSPYFLEAMDLPGM